MPAKRKSGLLDLMLRLAFLCVIFCWPCLSLNSQELLPANTPIQDAIDHYIGSKHSASKIIPAKQLDDGLLLRRTMLDLVGRIPTVAEVEAYAADPDPAKRTKLVDRLMAQESYYDHLGYDLNNILAPSGKTELESYLVNALKEKKGWDRMFKEMVNGDYQNEESKKAMQFVKLRVNDLDNLTNATSALFFGVNISCAKCHDHPLVLEWTQAHFYGMKSFFNRTFDNGDFLGERGYGQVKYTTTDGEKKDAKLMFLSGTVIEEPETVELDDEAKKNEKAILEKLKKEKNPVPPPKFSRRAKLVEIALTEKERDYFAKNIVNRIWHRIFGHGLVMPLDQMHPENPSSHPELLNWLARDTFDNGYDISRLIRGFVLSKTYSQRSVYEGPSRPEPSLFGVANLKPLSPRQYSASLAIASRNPSYWADTDKLADRIRSEIKASRGWASKFEIPKDGFQVSADEALLLSNESAFRDKIKVAKNRLAGELLETKSDDEMIKLAIKAVYSRSARRDELSLMLAYLERRTDRREQAVSQIVWALLTGSELRFNH